QRTSLRLDIEAQLLADAHQPMGGAGEAMAVDLKAVPQPRLHDALAALDLIDEQVEIGDQVLVEVGGAGRDHGAEQEPTEPRRWIDGEDEVSQRYTPCGC